jgi:[acyl-carrier-protein] S-malonyltransferase
MNCAWVFPGQGSQYAGMGRGFFFDTTPQVRRVFVEAEDISGQPLREISKHGSAELLRNCEVLEPLLTAFAISYARLLRLRNEHPRAVAGYSAGEISALYCAGVLTQTDALEIAALRGRILQSASIAAAGRMCAVIGLPAAQIEPWVADLRREGTIAIGGRNAPDHLTVSGETSVMRRFEEQAATAGAEVYPLEVTGAWHSSLAQRSIPRLAAALGSFRFRKPHVPFYSSVTGQHEQHPERLRQNLVEQVCKPVLWEAAVRAMHAQLGVRHFVEVGVGRSLRGITHRIPAAHYDDRFRFQSFYEPVTTEQEIKYA